MVKWSVLFKPLRICLGLVLLISRQIEISICLLVEFAYINSFHSSISLYPYGEFYGKRFVLLLNGLKLESLRFFGLDLVYETLEKVYIIRDRLQKTYNRQKSFADQRRSDLEKEEGDNVYLKISPIKWVVIFLKTGKLCPSYVGPSEILQRLVRLPMN